MEPVALILVVLIAGAIAYRVGHDDGRKEGYSDGYIIGHGKASEDLRGAVLSRPFVMDDDGLIGGGKGV